MPLIEEPTPRILFIDAYDSFSNNIIALAKELLGAEISSVKIDDPIYNKADTTKFKQYLKNFDGVICGPGPGSPMIPEDVGLIGKLWDMKDEDLMPVLGICLGFQSLACQYGGTIGRLKEPRHGVVANIHHNGKALFKNLNEVNATQYNSLHIRLEHPAQENGSKDLWEPSKKCPNLAPLAWISDDADNGLILHSIAHTTKPFYGVQYHPESICTDAAGQTIIKNWWDEAVAWMKKNGREFKSKEFPTPLAQETETVKKAPAKSQHMPSGKVEFKTMDYELLQPCDLIEALKINQTEAFMLESGTKQDGTPINSGTGRYSIVASLIKGETEHLAYHVSNRTMTTFTSMDGPFQKESVENPYVFFKNYMDDRKCEGGDPNSPFWGGLVGFMSYEAGLDTLNIKPDPAGNSNRPDICLAFIERSITIDHVDHKVYIQSIRDNDTKWIDDTMYVVDKVSKRTPLQKPKTLDDSRNERSGEEYSFGKNLKVTLPGADTYCKKVRDCQEFIRAGDSYELCLTDITRIQIPSRPDYEELTNWAIFKRLRDLNPAPFASFMHMICPNNAVSILSSSPERFLGWTREGFCSFRPIKGTVKKVGGMTKEKANDILNSSKERAENLMIVDLIRHDLHSIIGVSGDAKVFVEKLMGIEEYETVFQLVSVIEGQIPEGIDKNGIDVLSKSLPPGSMTGAPKKRSCEILQGIEENVPRGIYSGVIGYMDVGGGGDFSVVIRTAYKWDKDLKKNGEMTMDEWCIGAGGAVTIQSTDVGEYEEMNTKRDAWLQTFDGFD